MKQKTVVGDSYPTFLVLSHFSIFELYIIYFRLLFYDDSNKIKNLQVFNIKKRNIKSRFLQTKKKLNRYFAK